jgi:hypothetical protein
MRAVRATPPLEEVVVWALTGTVMAFAPGCARRPPAVVAPLPQSQSPVQVGPGIAVTYERPRGGVAGLRVEGQTKPILFTHLFEDPKLWGRDVSKYRGPQIARGYYHPEWYSVSDPVQCGGQVFAFVQWWNGASGYLPVCSVVVRLSWVRDRLKTDYLRPKGYFSELYQPSDILPRPTLSLSPRGRVVIEEAEVRLHSTRRAAQTTERILIDRNARCELQPDGTWRKMDPEEWWEILPGGEWKRVR